MDIYVGHSSSYDFHERLYRPLKDSKLFKEHNVVLPHETEGLFDSKSFFQEECDLFIAEVSKPSTGLGIELGWADLFDLKIILISKQESDVSSSLKVLDAEHIKYETSKNIPEIINSKIDDKKASAST